MRGNIVINYLASCPAGIENFTSRAIVNDRILTWVKATVKSPANPLRFYGSRRGVLNFRARVAGSICILGAHVFSQRKWRLLKFHCGEK